MNYEKIKTPEELMEYMDENILYGFYDYKNHKKYYGNDKNFNFWVNNFWTLSSPTDLQKYNIGHCFDQVELERDFFTKNNYIFKTFFIWFKCSRPNSYPTHTYLVYQDKKSKDWCWFEHSDYNNKGIHHFKSLQDALLAQKLAHIKFAKSYRKSKTDSTKIEIIEYNNVPYDCSFSDFINFILSHGTKVENKK